MKILVSICLFLIIANHVDALDNGLAKTPPMGWNTWNKFQCNINENVIKSVADSLVSKGLKDAGYAYIIIDDCWSAGRDKNGIILANTSKFPSGIKALADYIHSKGLKFGMYTDVGSQTCGGYTGSLNHEQSDANTFASWGVDYLKEDWCNTTGLDAQTQYKIMSDALVATGRPILFSICEWGQSNPWEWAKDVGNMWRTTGDIGDCFDCTNLNGYQTGWVILLESNVNLAPYAGPGHWNDPDMLEVGNSSLDSTECCSHFSMWCMLSAPLIAGNDIRNMTNVTKNILTAPEIIAIDQDSLGIQATRIGNNSGFQVWQKPLKDGSVAVALLNVSAKAGVMQVLWSAIGLQAGNAEVRDLWARKDLGTYSDTFNINVLSHGVVVVKIKGQRASVASLSLDVNSVVLNLGNSKVINASVAPSNTTLTCSSSNDSIVTTNIAGVNSYSITAKDTGSVIIMVTTADGSKSATCLVKVVPCNLPSPWVFNDIREMKGSVTFDNNVFTVAGSGSDIWNQSDQFAYLNLDTNNNTSISARIVSQQNTDPWAKAGLMFRETGNPNSSFINLATTPGNGLHLQWRPGTGGNCSDVSYGTISLPEYLKLKRSDNTFISYKSADGVIWDSLGFIKIAGSFGKNYKVGMSVLSHNTQSVCSVTFDNVEVDFESYFTPVEINEININNTAISVFPNPVSQNSFSVRLRNYKSGEKLDLSVVDMEGRIVVKKNVMAGNVITINLDYDNFPKGLYLLVISGSETTSRSKFVVK